MALAWESLLHSLSVESEQECVLSSLCLCPHPQPCLPSSPEAALGSVSEAAGPGSIPVMFKANSPVFSGKPEHFPPPFDLDAAHASRGYK